MNVEDLVSDISELQQEHDGDTPMCQAMEFIVYMYEEDKDECLKLQEAFNIKYPFKINIL